MYEKERIQPKKSDKPEAASCFRLIKYVRTMAK